MSLDLGGISHKIRKQIIKLIVNLMMILILLCNWKAWLLSQAFNMGNVSQDNLPRLTQIYEEKNDE